MNLLKNFTLLILLFSGISSFAQEDCTNGIDDDSDGLIDLNDDDCDCSLSVADTLGSLIPNPSFEENTCCPSTFSELTCADDWIQASAATSDYFNLCDFTAIPSFTVPSTPLPGDGSGEGYAGFYVSDGYQEYIGACLLSPMTAGTPYVLNLWAAHGNGSTTFDLVFYGTPDCADLPFGDPFYYGCPTGTAGSWMALDTQTVVVDAGGDWTEVTINFTPTVDLNAIVIGGSCDPGMPDLSYYYVDELTLLDSLSFAGGAITESGSWCEGDLMLSADIDTIGGSWQWYLEGVALVGETSSTLDVMPTGAGTYTASYFIGDECDASSYVVTIAPDPVASFTVDDVCFSENSVFTDESTPGEGGLTDWDWDFGDASGTSTDENPTYVYTSSGTFDVTLTVTNDAGCTDDTTITVEVFPAPEADFEFEINGISSADGLTGGCIANTVDFVDGSSVDAPGSITDWNWTFGDAGGSSDQNPSHNYGAAGTYTINLTVTTDNGCTDNFNMPIVMTSEPDISIVQNNPTCFGYSDGSFTVLISGGAGGEGSSFII
ncbi:MAG: PKD domain-containing protein, partial [Flavobacteriales bacterium]|nr:PKD domain-containing protein [Flavobacteriales bacterium]